MFLCKGGKEKRIFFHRQLVLIVTLILGLSMLSSMPPVGANGPEPVRINEIMYNPDGSDSGREWIELYNDAEYDINITGWKFYESNANHGLTYIQGSYELVSKGYGVICSDPTKFLIDYPGYTGTLYDSSFRRALKS